MLILRFHTHNRFLYWWFSIDKLLTRFSGLRKYGGIPANQVKDRFVIHPIFIPFLPGVIAVLF